MLNTDTNVNMFLHLQLDYDLFHELFSHQSVDSSSKSQYRQNKVWYRNNSCV